MHTERAQHHPVEPDLRAEEIFGNLSEIDPELFFDEDAEASAAPHLSSSEAEGTQEPLERAPSFAEWLAATIPANTGGVLETLPAAFAWAEEASERTSEKLSGITQDSLAAVSGAVRSLLEVAGSCGPLCMHGISSVAQLGSSGSTFGGFPFSSSQQDGLKLDSQGNFQLSGSLDQLAQATGFSREGLASGRYSAQEILQAFTTAVGDSFCQLFGFSLIGTLIDGLIPTPQTAA